MFDVLIARNGSTVSKFSCSSLCLSYDDGESVKAVVLAEPDVKVSQVNVLGCSAASAALNVSSSEYSKERIE